MRAAALYLDRARTVAASFCLSLCLRALCIAALLTSSACSIASHEFLEGDELAAFAAAGPIELELDRDRLAVGLVRRGPYKLVPGDLLEIRGPAALFAEAAGRQTGADSHLARVQDDGKVLLPLGKSVDGAGKSLTELEVAIASAVQDFLVSPPSIVVKIEEHATKPITILGAVENPGVHELRSDQLNLYSALSQAGGILKASNLRVGARLIRIRKPGEDQATAFTLPVKGLNVPDENVALKGGETIEVVRFEPDLFTVVGLVAKPGSYEYPPETTYNLLQAVAIAGGTDQIAVPPYATVFRKDLKTGRILTASFEITGSSVAESTGLEIKPGDVIAVQHTVASWSRSLVAQVLRFQFGFFVDTRTAN